ncbi:MAG: response regulator [Anaerolineales bacterium]|nr:response regulator [Anaerolineales bacterium]
MNITVLVADDHAVVRDGMSFLLDAQEDIEVVGTAVNGREAVQKSVDLQPDVVIMDINMPELDGIEATRQVLDERPATKIIILSIYATSEYIFLALQAGVLGYLLKETAGIEVVDAVRTVNAGRRYLSQKISDKVIDDYVQLRVDAGDKSPLTRLSPRETEVMKLVVEGKSSAEIAELLFLSPKTVETYRSRLMQKLDIHDLPSLVKFAIQHGLISLE